MGHLLAQADHPLFVWPLLLQSVNVSIKIDNKRNVNRVSVMFFSPFRVVYNDILRGNYLTGGFKSTNFVTNIKH